MRRRFLDCWLRDRWLSTSPQAEDVGVVSAPGVAKTAFVDALTKELEEIGFDFGPAVAEWSEPEKHTRESGRDGAIHECRPALSLSNGPSAMAFQMRSRTR
jgi:hypothetical protein